MTSNPHLSETTAAGSADHVGVAWDRGDDQWWDWSVSPADPDPAGTPLPVPGPPSYAGPLPTDAEVAAEPAEPYPLADEAVASFRAESYVTLPGLLSAGAVERLRGRLRELLDAAVDPAVGFQWLVMIRLTDPQERSAVLSPRNRGISARQLQADRVRLHQDNALGGNRTTVPRMVLATTYFADGARVVPAPTMVGGDRQKLVPGTGPGEVVAGERNPVLG